MVPLTCVLFAGGKSSRMGEDKSLLAFGGFPTLTEFQYRRLQSTFKQVYISTKNSDKFDFNADFILDPANVDFAPTAGFVSAFQTLSDECIIALSVDTPFINESVFKKLLDADRGDIDAVIARTPEGIHPMCGIYHRSLAGEFERMLREGDHRLGKLLSLSQTCYLDFEDEHLFANLNHPHEYQAALKQFKQGN